jgi:UDP-D-galactose:(glucosyl)LPS alpha-1,6-D-galactosyltransferase
MIGKQKQTDLLLSALSTVEGNWSLEIVGDGEDAPALKAMTRDLGLEERIVWHGWKSNPWQEPAQADLLILCSKFEGFPMALVEAIARGIPCISSDCPSGPSDIVQDGVNGWLYPVDAPAELARILARVIAHPELLPSTEQVRATAMRFDSTAVYGRIRKALEEILASKKRI